MCSSSNPSEMKSIDPTYMHVDHLPVTLLAAHNGRHDDKLVFEHEVAYTSLALPSKYVELERGGYLHK